MLLLESKSLDYLLDEGARLRLLDALQARGFAPLIRSARRRSFALALNLTTKNSSPDRAVNEVERLVAAQVKEDEGWSYAPGDLFCLEDHVLYLTFRDKEEAGIRAGIIYDLRTAAPLDKLEVFCREVRQSLLALCQEERTPIVEGQDIPSWEREERPASQALTRFIAKQDTAFTRTVKCKEVTSERLRAAEILGDQAARTLLRRAQEIRLEGYSPRLLLEENGSASNQELQKLIEAGLLVREVRVSCRKTGHALFDLPSADALAAITLSRAKCSWCALQVVEEVVDEVLNPTSLAAAFLEDGAWLGSYIYQIIRRIGIPESEIAIGPTSAYGDSHLVVNVYGNSFLFITRDGDLSPALSQRIIETVGELGTTHIVILVTGTIEDEGRMRLYEYAFRRARDGKDMDVLLLEGLNGAQTQIERSFKLVEYRMLGRVLSFLDHSLGMSASRLVIEKFRLMNQREAANKVVKMIALSSGSARS